METKKRHTAHNSAVKLQRFARERAEEQTLRVPWQRLDAARNQYIDWQEFYLWIRSIVEVENQVPDWLAEILDGRCPGFLPRVKELAPEAAKNRPLSLQLEDWIEDRFFGFAKNESWFNAVQYYAVRDPRYQRPEVCWSECVQRWKKAKPIRYPSFEEWKKIAAQCDDTTHVLPEAMASTHRVASSRLAEAVSRYIDWEAFGYWVRPALERGSGLHGEVARELERRCPGYLNAGPKEGTGDSRDGAQEWERLMLWINHRFFQDAQREGWFEAILMQARSHPRAIRTMEYADHCDEAWGAKLPNPYPSFEDWRREADAYVELPPK